MVQWNQGSAFAVFRRGEDFDLAWVDGDLLNRQNGPGTHPIWGFYYGESVYPLNISASGRGDGKYEQ